MTRFNRSVSHTWMGLKSVQGPGSHLWELTSVSHLFTSPLSLTQSRVYIKRVGEQSRGSSHATSILTVWPLPRCQQQQWQQHFSWSGCSGSGHTHGAQRHLQHRPGHQWHYSRDHHRLTPSRVRRTEGWMRISLNVANLGEHSQELCYWLQQCCKILSNLN